MSKNEEQVLEQTEKIWKFLDEMSLKNPKQYDEFINKIMKDGEENNLGPPSPVFAVQTEKIPQVIPIRRYFINFTKWIQLPKPENETSPVAMTTSDIRKEIVDKEWAHIVDVTLNPAVYGDEASLNQLKKSALVELVLRHIESKCLLKLSRKFQFCEKKYIGNEDNLLNFICPSAVTNKLQSAVNGNDGDLTLDKICHLSKDNIVKENGCLATGNKNNNNKQPITTNNSLVKELKTKTIKHENKFSLPSPNVEMNMKVGNIELRIDLPNVENVSECDLEMTETCLMLDVPGKYKLDFSLPIKINVDNSNAKFIKDQKSLLITAPYDQ